MKYTEPQTAGILRTASVRQGGERGLSSRTEEHGLQVKWTVQTAWYWTASEMSTHALCSLGTNATA